MIKRNLSEIIINNLNFLKFDNNFYNEMIKKNILKYFLNKDIVAIFGKDEFTIDYTNMEKSEIEISKISNSNENVLIVNFNNQKYLICNNANELLMIDLKNNEKIIRIKEDIKLYNVLLHYNKNEKIIEVQKISTNPETIFEYCKTIINSKGKTEYPPIQMRQMGIKNKDIELFTMIKSNNDEENKSLLKKMVDVITSKNIYQVETSYSFDDIYNYLDNIYIIMENEYQKNKEKTLTLK